MSVPQTPSPTGNPPPIGGPLENGVGKGNATGSSNVNGHDKQETTIIKDIYTSESETHTPSKEELETNEKNLQQSASYLGQLIFKLR